MRILKRWIFGWGELSIDAYAKKADAYFQEMAAMRSALNRHEEALKKIADKVGIDLGF